jgi:hypothetical protein
MNWGCVDCIHLGQDRDQKGASVNAVTNIRIPQMLRKSGIIWIGFFSENEQHVELSGCRFRPSEHRQQTVPGTAFSSKPDRRAASSVCLLASVQRSPASYPGLQFHYQISREAMRSTPPLVSVSINRILQRNLASGDSR